MTTLVVHCKKSPFDVYVGRNSKEPMHFGNPFSHERHSSCNVVFVKDRQTAVRNFELWLLGTAFADLEQERRYWIMKNLPALKGKRLGCFCAPAPCHGHVLAHLADTEW